MSENTRGWIGFSAARKGKIHDIVLISKERGWGNSKFCKIADGNQRHATGILAFSGPMISGMFS